MARNKTGSAAAIELIKAHADSMEAWGKYDFDIMLLGNKEPIKFSCVAQGHRQAWVMAAMKSSDFNMPCISIVKTGEQL